MMRKQIKFLFLLLIGAAQASLFISCGNNEENPKVNEIKIEFTSYPFYKDFSAIDTNNVAVGLNQLKEKYGEFLPVYLDMANVTRLGDTIDVAAVRSFITHTDFHQLFEDVDKKYPDIGKQDAALKDLFKHIKYYDSSITLPRKVYYYAAGLNYAAALLPDGSLGIGLDMFMGRDYKVYEMVPEFPSYITIRNTPENLPVAVGQQLYETRYPQTMDDKDLLSIMIDKGKETYFLSKVLPDTKKGLFFLFDEQQMKWCEKNEVLIYNYFIQNNLLYETNGQKIYRFVNNAPTSSGMPPESPGNTGVYIGYKIVAAYARNTGKSLKQILDDRTDSKTFLKKANYKP